MKSTPQRAKPTLVDKMGASIKRVPVAKGTGVNRSSIEHVELNLAIFIRLFDLLEGMSTDPTKKLEYFNLMAQKSTKDQLRKTILVPSNK